jgi:hypothetical protein
VPALWPARIFLETDFFGVIFWMWRVHSLRRCSGFWILNLYIRTCVLPPTKRLRMFLLNFFPRETRKKMFLTALYPGGIISRDP